MTKGFLFWLIFVLWILFLGGGFWGPEGMRTYAAYGGSLIPIVLIGLLGWGVYGKPIT